MNQKLNSIKNIFRALPQGAGYHYSLFFSRTAREKKEFKHAVLSLTQIRVKRMLSLSVQVLIFGMIVSLASCGGEGEIEQVADTPEEMGEVLFNAIKAEDAPAVIKYYAVESDIDEVLEKMNLSEKKRKKKKKKLIKKIENLTYKLPKTLAKIKEQDIDWEHTAYDWVDYQNFQKDSLTGADIYIVFSEDRQQYEIKLKECYPTSRGWVLFDEISFKGKRK